MFSYILLNNTIRCVAFHNNLLFLCFTHRSPPFVRLPMLLYSPQFPAPPPPPLCTYTEKHNSSIHWYRMHIKLWSNRYHTCDGFTYSESISFASIYCIEYLDSQTPVATSNFIGARMEESRKYRNIDMMTSVRIVRVLNS